MVSAQCFNNECTPNEHFHVYLEYSRACKASFPGIDPLTNWIKPLQLQRSKTLEEAKQRYLSYLRKKWDTNLIKGQLDTKPPARSSQTEILHRIQNGERRLKLELQFPGHLRFIRMSMLHRPPRKHKTRVLYIYGPPGTGKTTAISRTLQYVSELHPQLDYYCKHSLNKFWDGYDNQPIVWIDDPVPPSSTFTSEEAQQLKTVISTGPVNVEIKFGNMVFDSPLLIFSLNFTPGELVAKITGSEDKALLRRFTDTDGSHLVSQRGSIRPLIAQILRSIDNVAQHFYGISLDMLPIVNHVHAMPHGLF